jgi:RNA polymerase sigma-70 factor (ECF subfamily)
MSTVIVLAEYRTAPGRLLGLVRGTAAGDREAFTRLHDALASAVSTTVGAVVADTVRADAVASATFLEVWAAAGSHTAPGTDVAAWITGIALRRAEEPQVPDAANPGHVCDGAALAGLLARRSAGRRADGPRYSG